MALNDTSNNSNGKPSKGNEGAPPSPQRMGVRSLKTAEDIRRQQARLVSARIKGLIDNDDLRAYTNALTLMLRIVEKTDIQSRLERLEAALQEVENEH